MLKDIAVSDNGVAQARAARQPDATIEIGYSRRSAFSDMISLQVAIDLPLFPADRQDRMLAAKIAERDKALAMHEDHQRRLNAELESAFADWQSSQERIAGFEKMIIPEAAERVQAVLVAYRNNKADLAAVVDARRAHLELRLQLLSLQVAARRAQAQLEYFTMEAAR